VLRRQEKDDGVPESVRPREIPEGERVAQLLIQNRQLGCSHIS